MSEKLLITHPRGETIRVQHDVVTQGVNMAVCVHNDMIETFGRETIATIALSPDEAAGLAMRILTALGWDVMMRPVGKGTLAREAARKGEDVPVSAYTLDTRETPLRTTTEQGAALLNALCVNALPGNAARQREAPCPWFTAGGFPTPCPSKITCGQAGRCVRDLQASGAR